LKILLSGIKIAIVAAEPIAGHNDAGVEVSRKTAGFGSRARRAARNASVIGGVILISNGCIVAFGTWLQASCRHGTAVAAHQ